MPASSVKRTPDATGDDIKTFTDGDGKHIQAAALVDENAAQVGTAIQMVSAQHALGRQLLVPVMESNSRTAHDTVTGGGQ